MLKAYRRIFLIWHGYRRHLVLCQVLLLVSGAASIGMATLTQKVINQGLVAGDTTAIVTTGIWMAVLALVSGGAMAAGGAIVEQGPHDELMAAGGFSYDLYMSQFKGKAPAGVEL